MRTAILALPTALALLTLPAALPAAAGPWARDRGEVFLAFSGARDRHEVYGESGLGRGWTAGAKLAFSHRREPERAEEAQLFLWRRVWQGAEASLSFGLGAGARSPGPGRAPRPMASALLAMGRGLGGPLAPWVAAEVALERGQDLRAAKLDLTLGLRPGERWLAMAQVQAYRPAGGPALSRLELTGGLRTGGLRTGGLHLLVQPSVGLEAPRERRLRFSLWAAF